MSGKVHALAGIIGGRERQIISAVVDEIVSKPGEEYGLQLMPVKPVPEAVLYHEKISGFGGLTGERQLGEKGKAINAGSSSLVPFSPGSYQEHALWTEKDLLRYRKYGTLGDRGLTGITSGQLDELSRSYMKLQKRIKNRLQSLVWNALQLGTYVWQGVTTNFDIPGGNFINSATDWTDVSTSTPLQDLWELQHTYGPFLKYKIKEWAISPRTLAKMMASAQVLNVLKNYNITSNEINTVAKFLYPGLAPIKVVEDGFQNETLVGGKIVLGDHTFFVNDYNVLMIPDFGGTLYGLFGEMQISENINEPGSTPERPANGIYTFVDEKGLEQLESPFVKVVSGFNGGPNLMRETDVWNINVGSR